MTPQSHESHGEATPPAPAAGTDGLSAAEERELARLLRKLTDAGLRSPRMPAEVWRLLHGLVPQPAVEVVVTRTGRDVLLNHRRDRDWDGWEIPGGFMLYRESVEAACLRIAEREIGTSVAFERVVTAYMWPDHPYGSPLSLVCLCRPDGEPTRGRYYTELPANMVPHHADFARQALGLG